MLFYIYNIKNCYNHFIYDDSPVVLLISCKISGRLVTIPDPLGKKSLKKKNIILI